ncbi:MAG: hypothetical protein CL609_10165 [Anaerolineaceae bacterium]|nr:hypothetical protein [Anaerolineaceae bacterium]
MSKLQKILSAVVVLQILLIAVIFYAQRPAQAETSLLLEGYEPGNVKQMSITDGEGKLVVFEKQNGGWVLPENGNYPVTANSVDDILEKISTINTNRLVASSNTSFNRLQVETDNFQRKLVLETVDGKQTTIFLGSSPAANSTHIRLDGKNNVYLTNTLSAAQLSTNLSSWIDTSYLQLSSTQVQSVQIQNADDTYSFTLGLDGIWQSDQVADGQTFDANKWNSLLTSLTNIRMLEPVGKEILPEFGFDSPSATVVYVYSAENDNEQTDKLTIGNPTPDGLGYYAKLDSAEYVIKLSKTSAEKVTQMTPETYSSPLAEETSQP